MVARTKLDLNVVFSKPLSLFQLGYTFHYSISLFTFQSSMSPFSCILHFSLFNVNAGTKMIAGTELDCLPDCVVGGEHTTLYLSKKNCHFANFLNFLTWTNAEGHWHCQAPHLNVSQGSSSLKNEKKIFQMSKRKWRLFTKRFLECLKDCGLIREA